MIRDPTPPEVRAFSLIDSLLRRTQPKIRRGQLSEIRVPSGTLARGSSGRLAVYGNLTTLSSDSLTDRDRRKPRAPDTTELEEWRRVSKIIERFQPALRNGRLQEIVVRDGVLRLTPSGELMAIGLSASDTTTFDEVQVSEARSHEPDEDLDIALADYRAELDAETLAPFVVVDEPAEWVPPILPRRTRMRSSDFPTASRARSVRASKQRCPTCKGGLKANAGIKLHLAKGGVIRDVAGRKQTALGMLQVELWSEPRSFVGSSDFAAQRRPKPTPHTAPRIWATDLDPAEMRARIAAREPVRDVLSLPIAPK